MFVVPKNITPEGFRSVLLQWLEGELIASESERKDSARRRRQKEYEHRIHYIQYQIGFWKEAKFK